jgi:hypothetical protein
MGDTQEVDIPALTATGKAAGESADVLDAVCKTQLPSLGGTKLAGWGFDEQLTSGAATWTAYLADLRKDLRAFADGLVTSAKEYQDADETAAATVKRPMYGPWAE